MKTVITNTKYNPNSTSVSYQIQTDAGEVLEQGNERIAYASTLQGDDPELISRIDTLKSDKVTEMQNYLTQEGITESEYLIQKSEDEEEEERIASFKGYKIKLKLNFDLITTGEVLESSVSSMIQEWKDS